MTEDRLREIAFDMEEPLIRLDGLEALLIEMVDMCGPSHASESRIYALFQRNLGGDLKELRKLWEEFFALAVRKDDSPLKAVEE